MSDNNKQLTATGEESYSVTKYMLESIFEYAKELFEENLLNKIYGSGLVMPEDFYEGVSDAFEFIWEFLCDKFGDYDWDDSISLNEVLEGVYLDKAEKPKSLEEVKSMAGDLYTKRSYHELLRLLKWSAIECEEIKSRAGFYDPVDLSSAREWAEGVIKKYGAGYLDIKDFSDFGFLYGHLDWLDWLRFYIENPDDF